LFYYSNVPIKDVLIFATDGLLDNLPLDYLSKIISTKINEENLKEKMIEITNLCLTIALDDKFLSPFAIEARKGMTHMTHQFGDS